MGALSNTESRIEMAAAKFKEAEAEYFLAKAKLLNAMRENDLWSYSRYGWGAVTINGQPEVELHEDAEVAYQASKPK